MQATTTLTSKDISRTDVAAQRALYAAVRSQIAELTGESIEAITIRHGSQAQSCPSFKRSAGYAYCLVAIQDLKDVPFRGERVSTTQESYGDRYITRLTTPIGWTKQQHLEYCYQYCHKSPTGSSVRDFKISDGEVYEIFFCSIGD